MKILVFSHCGVVARYRRRFELLAGYPGVRQVTVVIPPRWWEGGGMVEGVAECSANYRVRVERAAFSSGSRQHAHYYPEARKIVRDESPDLVFLDEEPHSFVTFHMATAVPPEVPLVFSTYQNLGKGIREDGLLRTTAYRVFRRRAFRRCCAAQAVGEDAASLLRQSGFRGAVFILPIIGYDDAPGGNETGAPVFPFARHRGALVAGFVGRLIHEKGPDLLLQACSRLPTIQVMIAGSGPLRGELERFAGSLGLLGRVAFVGPVAPCHIGGFFRSIDALVLPSRPHPQWVEQYGRVLVEAMAEGAVPVGSDSGEIPHVIGDAGLTFPAGDAHLLALALGRLEASGSLLAACSGRARERAARLYSNSRIAQGYYLAFRRVLGVSGTESVLAWPDPVWLPDPAAG